MNSVAEAVVNLKADKDKNVRESCMNCISGLKGVLGDGFLHSLSQNSKSVVSMKKDAALRSGSKGGSRDQGQPRTVDEDPFREGMKQPKGHLFPKVVPAGREKAPATSSKAQPKLINAASRGHQNDTTPKKQEPRQSLKQQKMSEAFRESMSKGVEIYVNYPCPEEGDDSGDEMKETYQEQPEPLPLAQGHCQDEGILEQQVEHHAERVTEQKEGAEGDLEQQGDEEVNEIEEIREEPTRQSDELGAELEACGEGEITQGLGRGDKTKVEQRVPITDTDRMEIDEAEIDYNPRSFRQRDKTAQRPTEMDDPESEEFRQHEDRLSRENQLLQREYIEHQQIIDYQNRRIEGLMMQVNNLSTNLNIVLNKATSLEQSVFQLNYQSHMPYGGQVMPQPGMVHYGVPPLQLNSYGQAPMQGSPLHSFQSVRSQMPTEYLYQVPVFGGLNEGRPFNTTTSMSTPRGEIEKVRRQIEEKSHEISEWQRMRREEELKLKEKKDRMNKVKRESLQPQFDQSSKKVPAPKITGENKVEYRPKRELPVRQGGVKQSQSNNLGPLNRSEIAEEKRIYKADGCEKREDSLERASPQTPSFVQNRKKPSQVEEFLEGNRGDEEQLERENRVQLRAAKTMNLTLARILKDNEYRRLLDFLTDSDNFKSMGMLDSSNLDNLVVKMTDMLSYKAEAYVEECIPWITRLIHVGQVSSLRVAEDLLYVVKMVLGADKKRKVYQNHVMNQLQALTVDIEELIVKLKSPSRQAYH